jgi:dynein heavy chain
LQGLLFSTPECILAPIDVVRLWVHESKRVYGDKLVDEKDADAFIKFQIDAIKKNFEVSAIQLSRIVMSNYIKIW